MPTDGAGHGARGATVEFRRVSKRYAGAAGSPGAVDDLSLTVPAGEICALVGPSGCGKTTSLKLVNRLVEPTAGEVLIDGRDVSAVEPTALRRGIGYVIQQVGLLPHRTIGQNVATVPHLLGWPKARTAARVEELLALVGLDPARYRDRYPAQLSGGERQRVGVARALAAEPPVMLMDEPFGAVDPIVRERLQDEFLRLHRQLGMTVLFVTHDIDEAVKMGSRVAVMRAGRLLQYAPPGELLARPADDFVSRFVGADRALKRLALIRVGDVPVSQPATAGLGEPAGEVRARYPGERSVLLVNADGRPLGWVDVERLPAGEPVAAEMAERAPIFQADTSLRAALSQLLTSSAPAGIVDDSRRVFRGVLTLEAIRVVLRATGADAAGAAPNGEASATSPAGER